MKQASKLSSLKTGCLRVGRGALFVGVGFGRWADGATPLGRSRRPALTIVRSALVCRRFEAIYSVRSGPLGWVGLIERPHSKSV